MQIMPFNYLKQILASAIVVILCGCGVSNNVIITTTNGQCVKKSGAPYCMSVNIQNNGGGQNWINSTNFPISNINLKITGVSNLQSPATNKSAMDPNNCTGSTIPPGKQCTFYLQLTGEAFPVTSQESIQIQINYTINNTLFGNSTTTGSTNLTLYELTNLYIMQSNGNLTVYNSAWNNYGLVESADMANSLGIDNSSYGLLYIGGNLGIYQYGISNDITSSSIGNSNVTGANNLFTVSNNLYSTNIPTASTFGIWSYSLNNQTWSNTPYTLGTPVATNVHAVSTTPLVYVAGANNSGTSNTSIYYCSSNPTPTCLPEGNTGIVGNITSLAFFSQASMTPAVTGLYAGTTNGLFVESGTTGSINTSWSQVSGITAQVNNMVVAKQGESNILLAGDVTGKIWSINSATPKTASLLDTVAGPILAMTNDNISGVAYISAGYGGIPPTIYSCISNTCVAIPNLNLQYSNPVIGMAIGSFLTNSLSNPYDNGSL